MSSLEIFAVIISLIGVTLTIKRNMWCWWFNFAAFLLYAYLFYTYKLYGETILKKYYWKPYFWSDSYFISSVSENSLHTIKQYIRNQGKR